MYHWKFYQYVTLLQTNAKSRWCIYSKQATGVNVSWILGQNAYMPHKIQIIGLQLSNSHLKIIILQSSTKFTIMTLNPPYQNTKHIVKKLQANLRNENLHVKIPAIASD